MPLLVSLPAIFLSLMLCISLGDALAIGHHERYHRMLKRAPEDFRKILYPRMASAAVTAGTAPPSGFVGTSTSFKVSNFTFTALPAVGKSSSIASSILTTTGELSGAVFLAAVTTATIKLAQQTSLLAPAAAQTSSLAAASLASGGSNPAPAAQASPISAQTATFTFQPTEVTQVISVYQICENSAGQTVNCSPVQQTITTTACSTVLTGFFTKATISECDQSITFSTKSSFNLLSATVTPAAAAKIRRRADSSTTFSIQSIVSYFIAPWQSIAADNPSGITVLVCTLDASGGEQCNGVEQAWQVQTQMQPVLATSTVSISQSLTTEVIIVLAAGQTVTAPASQFDLTTTVTFTSMMPVETTVTSDTGPTTSTVLQTVIQAAAAQAAPTTMQSTISAGSAPSSSSVFQTAFLAPAAAATSSDTSDPTTTHTQTQTATKTVRIALVSTTTSTSVPLSTGTGLSNSTIASACLWRNATTTLTTATS